MIDAEFMKTSYLNTFFVMHAGIAVATTAANITGHLLIVLEKCIAVIKKILQYRNSSNDDQQYSFDLVPIILLFNLKPVTL